MTTLTSSRRSPDFRRPSAMAAPLGKMFFTYIGGAKPPAGLSLVVMLNPKPSGPVQEGNKGEPLFHSQSFITMEYHAICKYRKFSKLVVKLQVLTVTNNNLDKKVK